MQTAFRFDNETAISRSPRIADIFALGNLA